MHILSSGDGGETRQKVTCGGRNNFSQRAPTGSERLGPGAGSHVQAQSWQLEDSESSASVLSLLPDSFSLCLHMKAAAEELPLEQHYLGGCLLCRDSRQMMLSSLLTSYNSQRTSSNAPVWHSQLSLLQPLVSQ